MVDCCSGRAPFFPLEAWLDRNYVPFPYLLLLMVVVQTDWKTPWNLRRRRRRVPSSPSSFLAKTRPTRLLHHLHRSVGTDFRCCSYFFTEEYIKRARENRERSTNVSLQRSLSSRERFNFSKSLSLRAKISPLSVHLSSSKTPPRRETFVSVKSVVVLCEPARVCVCVCFLRYIKIAKKILSSSFPPKLCFSFKRIKSAAK